MRKIYIPLAAIIGLLLGLICSLLPSVSLPEDKSTMYLIGHRGYSSRYKENTLDSFRGALEAGFDGVEMDVYEDKDGELIVFHGKSIKKLTGFNGKIWDQTKESRKVHLVDGKYMIPTLDEVFEICSRYKSRLMVHVKSHPSSGYLATHETIKKIIGLAEKYKLEDQIVLFGDRSMIQEFSGKYDVDFGVLTEAVRYNEVVEVADWAKKYNVKVVCFINLLSLNYYEEAKLKVLRERGIRPAIYKVKTRDAYEKLRSLGVHMALSDYYLK